MEIDDKAKENRNEIAKERLEDERKELQNERHENEIKNVYESACNELSRMQEYAHSEINKASELVQSGIDKADQLKNISIEIFDERSKILHEGLELINNTQKILNEHGFDIVKDWYDKALNDYDELGNDTHLELHCKAGENPQTYFENYLESKGFQKGDFDSDKHLSLLDGDKKGYDNQRFRDEGNELQEHIRFNDPKIIENTDGSNTISIDICTEIHRHQDGSPVYGEGKGIFGDLEPNRRSPEHAVYWFTENYLRDIKK